MAHRVMNHNSKCRNLHGHRYKIEVGVDDRKILDAGASNEGMVIDYSDLKRVMMEEIDEVYDHNSVFHEKDPIRKHIESISSYQYKQPKFVPFIPTAENLSQWWFVLLKKKLDVLGVKIRFVKVWETLNSTATYEES